MTREDQLLNRSEIIPSRTDVLSMAREAGFKVDWQHADVAEIKAQRYERFAALIASRVAAASASVEREACAKVAETYREWDDTGMGIADAIRARGQA